MPRMPKRKSRIDWPALWRAFDEWLEVGVALYGGGPTITQLKRLKIRALVEEELRRAS